MVGSWCLLGVEPDSKEPAGSPQDWSTPSGIVVISFRGHLIGVCPCPRTARSLRAGARSAYSGVHGTRPSPGWHRLSAMKSWARRERRARLGQEELVGVKLSLQKCRNAVRMEEACLRIEFLK